MRIFSIIALSLLFIACVRAECAVDAKIVARASGLWQTDGVSNQIYDVRITNTGDCRLFGVVASIALDEGSNITQSWNIPPQGGQFSVSLNPGESEAYRGFVVAGPAVPYFDGDVAALCPGGCPSASTSSPSTSSPSTSSPSTSAPSTSAPSTSSPSTSAATTSAPSTGNNTCGFKGNFFSAAFSPSTGRIGLSSGSGGYRVGYALQNCAGYPPAASDCVVLLVCIDCHAAISVSDGPLADGQYVAAVSSGSSSLLSASEAQVQAYQQCSCLASGSGRKCSQ